MESRWVEVPKMATWAAKKISFQKDNGVNIADLSTKLRPSVKDRLN